SASPASSPWCAPSWSATACSSGSAAITCTATCTAPSRPSSPPRTTSVASALPSDAASASGGDAEVVLGEHAVHELDGAGALAHGGSHPFDGTAPHVAGGEPAGHAALERERSAPQRPLVGGDVVAGRQEAVVVALQLLRQPAGQGPGADQHQQPTRRNGRALP